jgi:uncharacterized protein
MLTRHYKINELLEKNKVLVIYGPRRIGKTTLVENFLKQTILKFNYVTGDSLEIQSILSSQDFDRILPWAQNYELIVIDEAQQVPNIGMGLKILVDHVPEIQIIATGSASFALSQKIGEPLTGRKRTLNLFAMSQSELLSEYANKYELKSKLENFLIYGSYPEVITANDKKKKIEILEEISSSYLLKDVLMLENVKSSNVLMKLLKMLAFQVGSEVSLNELATKIGLDIKTVDRYLDILEKGFVIKSLSSYSRNLRKELTRKYKYYFFDNGIRNALISQFNSIDNRDDIGKLWENFLVMERLKKQAYAPIYVNNFFWRTYDQKEIDWVEERDGKLFGFEFKWGDRKIKEPKLWKQTYDNAEYQIIDQENYLEFVL